MNPRLALFLAWRGLSRHRTVAWATVLGVAIGMTVVGAILIVDANSIDTPIHGKLMPGAPVLSADPHAAAASSRQSREAVGRVLGVTFERGEETARSAPVRRPGVIPTQEGSAGAGLEASSPPVRRGEDDYQVMRLAVRLASLLAFSVGAVIVFYTMRFSVASRGRELSLLLCLGEGRANLVLALVLEAFILGLAGTLVGFLLAFPAASALIDAGISTTGRIPSRQFAVPAWELAAMVALSLSIALLGVVGPARGLKRLAIAEVLQPRFASSSIDERHLRSGGFVWLAPPLMVAGWLALRPFLESWLSVVQLFVLEAMLAAGLGLAVLWGTNPLLRGAIGFAELLLRPMLPLESLLAGRRLRLTSPKLVFTLAGVTLVFSLLTALHDVTRALKHEIGRWAGEALEPYVFLRSKPEAAVQSQAITDLLTERGLHLFRMSRKIAGELPLRLVAAADVNPFLREQGRAELGPGLVLVSRTLAARFDIGAGDRVLIHTEEETHRFRITEVADDLGFFSDDGQYVDLKSYLVFSEGNPLFDGPLAESLGKYAALRKIGGGRPSDADVESLSAFYRPVRYGWHLAEQQQGEIDRDFTIFDFILAMTLTLAAVGVANVILIQVIDRQREFSVLRSLGVSRLQTTRSLIAEGAVIGLVAGLLSLLVGHAFGAVSVAFLDRFTLFDYSLVLSPMASAGMVLTAVLVCSLAAIYPALLASRVSSAESLHYE